VQEEVWASALGQVASGTIDVDHDHVRLDVMLPWRTALLADKRQLVIRAEGTLMLEKKGPNALAQARVHE
jgi:hypothetical protein